MLTPMERRPCDPPATDGVWLLLAEWNHRVRNELQVALSALRLARRGLGSDQPGPFIEDALLRLEGLSNMHHLLDRRGDQGSLAQRLEALCRATSLSRAAPRGISLALALDEVAADDETAWTVCVVASEFMTNALKHAFPGRISGLVGVTLRQEAEGLLLTVTDNGIGSGAARVPVDSGWGSPGLGSRIVTELAERTGGMATRVGGPAGTIATFRAPGGGGCNRPTSAEECQSWSTVARGI